MADDLCQGALPAVPAFMYQEGRLDSFADVALLIMAATIINAPVQPVAGFLADQKPRPCLMPSGMLAARAGVKKKIKPPLELKAYRRRFPRPG